MLTKENALSAYAAMMNTQDVSKLEALLADDFHYASQWVFTEIKSKQAYLDYIKPKLESVKQSGSMVWAEMAYLEQEISGPCVVMAQGQKDNLVSLVLAEVADGKISRLDMCGAPSPHSAKRSGRYPDVQDPGQNLPFNTAATLDRHTFNGFVNDLYAGKSFDEMSPATKQWWLDRY
jgi:hypothetical protein